MELLENPIRGYAWGSRTVIAAMQGRAAPTREPEAELWMGAHPDSPSHLACSGGRVALDAAIGAEPLAMLGDASLRRFGPRLPFMLKVLAAQESLSLQAHPDADQAIAGYAAGRARGGASAYVDPYPKPELLVALDDFDALCGFRHPCASARALAALDVSALDPVVDLLRAPDVEAALRGAVEALLRWPERSRREVVAAVAASAVRTPGLEHVADLASRYPDDMGVPVTLLLNHISLAADDAIWMPAGNLHAYLRGVGLEVLASSDNVLRGGLTAKPVDVDELLRVLRYQVLADPLVKPVASGPGVTRWPAPAPEFDLCRVAVRDGACIEVGVSGPRIAFVRGGRLTLGDGVAQVRLASGQAAFGPAGRPLTVRGDGVVFIATTGR